MPLSKRVSGDQPWREPMLTDRSVILTIHRLELIAATAMILLYLVSSDYFR